MTERALGIDIGGTTTKIAVVAAGGSIESLQTIPTACQEGPADLVEQLLARAEELARTVELRGIGVAVAGFPNEDRSALGYNPNLPALVGYPIRAAFEQRFKLPIELDADSNSSCLAEFAWGAGRGSRRFLVMTAGTGLGGGMIVDGQLVRFAHQCMGDLGHVLVEPGGPMCEAGCRGCAEALVSAAAIEQRAASMAGGWQTS